MRRLLLPLLLCLLVVSVNAQNDHAVNQGETNLRYPFQDTTLPVDYRVDDLLRRLTLEEKLAFMQHQNPGVPRLGLRPYSWWNEALHGVGRNGKAVVYPMPIAMAATFDPDLVERVFQNIASEARAKYFEYSSDDGVAVPEDNKGLTFFTPNINILRDPRWGKGMETFGEDPCLTSQMGLAVVRGLQGRDTTRFNAVACVKHLAVHSGPESTRHQFDAQVSPRDLWTTYLPAFEHIVRHSNVGQVMCAYNRVGGEPCCTNKELLVDILRHQWKYNGILVTDCWALNDCWERDTVVPRHETHPTAATAAAAAFGSEVDLECGSGLTALRTAVDSSYISVRQINTHLRRVLRARLMVGVDTPHDTVPFDRYRAAVLGGNMADESLVLLKNSDLLPFHFSKRLAVVGPNADDSVMALGNYNGEPEYVATVRGALEAAGHCDLYAPVCGLVDEPVTIGRRLVRRLRKVDAIVFVGGLSPQLEGEELKVDKPGFRKGDRTQIELPEVQVRAIKELRRKTRKPIVLVLCAGSAVGLEQVVDDVDAVIVGWYGGQDMGTSVASALYSPSHTFGRLPVTFYRNTHQLPPFDSYSMQGRTYRYMEQTPLYAFGYGLEYTKTGVGNVRFNRNRLALSWTTTGPTVVQVYLKNLDDPEGPRKSLVAFKRQNTVPGQTLDGGLVLDPDLFRYFDEATQQLEPPTVGTRFVLQVGTSSRDEDLQDIPFRW